MSVWMCGGDWKQFGNESHVSGAAGEDFKKLVLTVLSSHIHLLPSVCVYLTIMRVQVGHRKMERRKGCEKSKKSREEAQGKVNVSFSFRFI